MAAIGKAHDQLSQGTDIDRMDVGKYIEALCKDLDESVVQSDVRTDVEEGIEIQTDRAISAALIVNELITNAAKYAGGKILIRVYRASENEFAISVRDEGSGIAADFDPRKAKGLGMRIITSFAQQLDATIKARVA